MPIVWRAVPEFEDATEGEAAGADAIVLIASPRRLMRETLALELKSALPEIGIVSAEGLDELGDLGSTLAVCVLDARDAEFGDAERREALVRLRTAALSMRVLALCHPGADEDGRAWLAAGADGCFSTEDPLELLIAAVRVLLAGGMFLPAPLVRRLLR